MKLKYLLRTGLVILMFIGAIKVNVSSAAKFFAASSGKAHSSSNRPADKSSIDYNFLMALSNNDYYWCYLSASITSHADVTCHGGSNGHATAAGSGGASPYTFHWSNGQSTSTATNLIAGTYTVTVSDCGGCSATASVTITQPSALLTGISAQTNVNCSGLGVGSATATATGGTWAYSYKWSTTPQQTTATATNLQTGTYTVTVTDAHGCTATTLATILQSGSSLMTGISAKTNVSCFGMTNGSAKVTATGGITPYTYKWSTSPQQTTATAVNLGGGTYTVTVMDAQGCYSTNQTTITQPSALVSGISQLTNVSCFGLANGSVTAMVTGGTLNYSYKWSTTPQQTTAAISNLGPGTFTVTVTDAHGCTTMTQAAITQPATALTAGISSKTNINCYGLLNGSATVTASGGTIAYHYKWSTSPQQTTAIAVNLGAGTYSVTITDAHGCTAIAQTSLTQPSSSLNANVSSVTNPGCFGGSNGSVTVTVSGGTMSYQYKWSTSPQQTTPTAINLGAGTYTVTVTDANGCTDLAQATLTTVSPCPVVQHPPFTDFNSTPSCGSQATTLWLNIHTKLNGQLTTNGDYVLLSGGTITATNIISNPLINNTPFPDGKIIADNTVASPKTTFDGVMWITRVPLGYSSSDIFITGGIINSSTGFTANSGHSTTISGYWYSNISSFTSSWFYGLACYQPEFSYSDIDGQNQVYPIVTGGYPAGTPAPEIWNLVTGGSGGGGSNCSGSYSSTTNYSVCNPQLDADISALINVNCFGGNTGSATVTASGGTTPYHYVWSTTPMQTTQTATSLMAGTYTVTVTDVYNCSAVTASATITQPPNSLITGISAKTNINCFGGNNGAATVTASGGTPAYTYKWSTSPQQITQTAINLGAGTYTVTVTDAHGCTTLTQATITQPVLLVVAISSQTNLNCSGQGTGSATATVSGGTLNYTYKWSTAPQQTTATASNLAAGTYTITVTDAHGCTATTQATISQSGSSLVTGISAKINVSCFGMTNGSATVTVTGGVTPYTYKWSTSPQQTTASAVNLGAGTYTVTVMDAQGCFSTNQTTITQPSGALLSGISPLVNVSCFGLANGSATVTVSGGTLNYTYKWSTAPQQTTAAITNLGPGTYSVTVTDAHGCTTMAQATITQPGTSLIAGISSKTDVKCYGLTSGSATVTASGGTLAYTYKWSTTPQQTTATAVNLGAGTYNVTVTDAHGCTTTAQTSITQPSSALYANISSITNPGCFGGSNGSVTVTVSGGTLSYQYKWSTSPQQTTATASNLSAGTYTVTVTDANGCTDLAQATLTTISPCPAVQHPPFTDFNSTPSCGSLATTLWLNVHTKLNGELVTNGDYVLLSGGTITATNIISNPLINNTPFPDGKIIADNTVSSPKTTFDGVMWTTRVPLGYISSDIFITGGIINSSTGFTANTGHSTTISGYWFSNLSSFTSSWFYGLACYQPEFAYSNISGQNQVYPIVTGGYPAGTPAPEIGNLVTGGSGGGGSNCSGSYSSTTNYSVCHPQLDADISAQININCFGGNTGSATVTASGGTTPYYYVWSTTPVQTTQTATALVAGTYTVTVTDLYGCSAVTASVSITQPPNTFVAGVSAKTNINCFGGNNGSATVTASGGTTPYSYKWSTSPQQTTATVINLVAGTYTVTVTDVHGCITLTQTIITQPVVILASILSHTNLLCNGANNGIITVTASGGTAPYKYLWNTGQTINPLTGLAAGTYTVSVTDAHNCTPSVASATITQPAAVFISLLNKTNLLCNGLFTGSIRDTAFGGTPPYKYTWNTGQTTNLLTGLAAGTYTITVTDANNCTPSVASTTITQPDAILASILNHTDLQCNGVNTGTITATASGGTPPFHYIWNTGQTSNPLTGLSAGTYTVLVIDADNCTFSLSSISITQPPAILASILNHTDPLCNGSNNGNITVTASGGTPAYTYKWSTSPQQTTATAINLVAGTYTVTVTDAHGCMTLTQTTITQPGPLMVVISAQTNVSCFGQADGSATASASGGTPSYSYKWSTSPQQTTATAGNLVTGTYTVTVTDAHGCTSTTQTTITQSSSTVVSGISAKSDVSCFGLTNGSATVTVTGGTSPYTYKWSTTPQQTTATASNLGAGTYTVTVMDAHGCFAMSQTTITQPGSPLASGISVKTNVNCFGGNNGSATVTASGGTTPYVYAWSTIPVQTTQTASALIAGTYTATVTDSHGCSTSAQAVITQPSLLIAGLISQTNVSCFGGNNGSATVTASGGTTAYSYMWSDALHQTTTTAGNLMAGTYTVTVTDSHGCTTSAQALITQPALLIAAISAKTNVNCFGGNNGSATVTASGGTTPYTYMWSDALHQTTATASNLMSGTYTVTVTDSHGCTTSAQALITQPATLLAGISAQTNVSCFGGNNGSATVTASGGTTPYSYMWSDALHQTTATASNLMAGTYTVTVTDSHGCTTSAQAVITQPLLLIAGISATTNVSCFGGNNGSATVTASGGTTAYSYLWSDALHQTTATASNLMAGTYTVTVTDSHGCNTAAQAVITQPSVLISGIISQTNVNCFGGNNGSATVTVSGGTTAYSYLWSDALHQTTATASSLMSGTYTVTVTDSHGCTTSAQAVITQPALLIAAISAKTNVNCFGGDNGSATVTASGGTTPYTYMWSDALHQTTATASNLISGTYTVTVTDSHGCTTSAQALITQPATLLAGISAQTNVSCFGGNNGSATVTASGGTTPYSYMWSDALHQTTATASNLMAGTYTVTVTDSHGCTTSAQAVITQPLLLIAGISATTNVSCFGGNNGSATVTASGGTTAYSYLWSDALHQTTATASNLMSGTYTVTVTDSHGCTTAAQAVITQPVSFISGISSQTNVNCFGGNNGSATVTASGGTTAYSYLWSDALHQTTATASSLMAGTYTVTVTDSHGCTTSAQAVITQPGSQLSAVIINQVDINCSGLTGGSLTVSATGGTTMYTYLWNTAPQQTTTTISNLSAGTYTVTVTDAHGCTTSAFASVTEPKPLNAVIISTPVPCFGGTNGTATASASGGTGVYSYLWSTNPAQTTQMISGLTAGTYSVTVSDSHLCSVTASTSITQPALLDGVATDGDISCFNANNGFISLTVFGGTPAYHYLWNTGNTTSTITGLSAGSYLAIVTDAAGCTTSYSEVLTQPGQWGPQICSPDSACQGSVVRYCVCDTSRANSTFEWTITCGTIVDGCCSHCISVLWDHCNTGTICVTETRHDGPYDGCTATTCKTITLNPVPQPVITGPPVVNFGQTATYCITYNPNELFSWAVTGGTVVSGQGTNCISVLWNSFCTSCHGQVIAYETRNGCCGTDTLNVTVIPGTDNLTGYVIYNNPYGTGLNGVAVTLRNSSGIVLGTAYTGPNPTNSDQPGFYAFPGIPDGTYHLTASFNGVWGGNNATDALIIQLHTVGLYPLNGINLKAADVTNDFTVNATDALWVKLRTVGMVNSYPAGDWLFTDTTFVLSSTASVTLDALCVGDVNGSYIPSGLKQRSIPFVTEKGVQTIGVNQDFNYTIFSNSPGDLGAMTLFMGYNPDRYEVEDVSTFLEGMKFVITDGQVKLAWSNTTPLTVKQDDPILTLRVKAKEAITSPENIFDVKPGSEFADAGAVRYENYELMMSDVVSPNNTMGFSISNFPNPFQNMTDIVYTLPEQGHVKLVLTNLFGEELSTLVDADQISGSYTIRVNPVDIGLKPGVYLYRIKVDGVTNTFDKTNKMIFTR